MPPANTKTKIKTTTTSPTPAPKSRPAPKPAARVKKAAAKPAPAPVQQPAAPTTLAMPTRHGPAPSMPAAPPAPVELAPRHELAAPRDIGRMLRHGEQIGPYRIEPRWPGVSLPVTSGHLAITDPTMPRPVRNFDRPVPAGAFRLMLSIAHGPKGERLAAAILHLGRPPIARWTVAHWEGQKAPREVDKIPRVAVAEPWLLLLDGAASAALGTTPWVPPALPDPVGAVAITVGNTGAIALPVPPGTYAAYWAVNPDDRPICLVIDFDIFTQKDWKAT